MLINTKEILVKLFLKRNYQKLEVEICATSFWHATETQKAKDVRKEANRKTVLWKVCFA